MKYSKDWGERIIQRLQEKGAPRPCDNCGTQSWSLVDGFIFLSVQDELPGLVLGGRGAPSAAVTCNNCGNTRLINLVKLGFGEEFKEPEAEGVKKQNA